MYPCGEMMVYSWNVSVEGTVEIKEQDSHCALSSLQVREGMMQEVDDNITVFSTRLVGKMKWVQ